MPQKERPVLYLSGLEDVASEKIPVRGRRLSIASRSPGGCEPEGKVEALVPRAEDLAAFKKKEIDQDEFRNRYVNYIQVSGAKLAPRKLVWVPYSFFRQREVQLVEPGDVLFCLCLHAQKDGLECHRLWAAELLMNAGWKVILDGDVFC